jgi:NTE family protein
VVEWFLPKEQRGVRLPLPAHMKRKKVGLALGSGGARGIAHIGVLKALEQHDIQIDYIVGASAGAVVGAYYAVHGSIDGLEKIMVEMRRVELASFLDVTTPKRGFIKGKKMKQFFDEIYENKEFDKTKTPLAVVATDLRKGIEVVIRKGNIAQAVLASASLPGIFPPVKTGKQLLVDGGVVNPTPVDVVHKMGATIVIGVDLTMKGNVSLQNPNIFEVVSRSFDVLRSETTKLTAKKVGSNLVIIKPKLDPEMSFVRSFSRIEEMIKQGEKATESSTSRIKKLLG